MRDDSIQAIDAALCEEVVGEGVFDTKDSFFQVGRLLVKLPNGKTSKRDFIHHPGASAMVVLFEDSTILLERQWRAPLQRAFWEIPAGKIDPGETAFQTAQRELAEETHLAASRWTHLGTLHNAIGYSDEHIEIFLAQELTQTEGELDDNEFLTLRRFALSEAIAMTMNGEITDVKTICALSWVEKHLAGLLVQAKIL